MEIMRLLAEYSLINNFPVPMYWHIFSTYLILPHDYIPTEWMHNGVYTTIEHSRPLLRI